MDTTNPDRKAIPLFEGLVRYFPKALREIAKVSYMGNPQHHPDKPLHWDRSKSTDEPDALLRHLFDYAEGNKFDTDGSSHLAKIGWRALAFIERELEK